MEMTICDQAMDINVIKASYNFNEKTDVENPK